MEQLMALDTNLVRQAAAIPLRDGRLCLVTSSSGKRWVIPKGNFEPGKTACEIALQESWEEAGLTGVLQREPVGSYVYQKYGSTHHVLVFILHVTDSAERWPEEALRRRVWLRPSEALERLDDPGLRDLIRGAWRQLRREKDRRVSSRS
jgi:8-oxo-dGTP pyrophosphatase MutT (NUDIX family)